MSRLYKDALLAATNFLLSDVSVAESRRSVSEPLKFRNGLLGIFGFTSRNILKMASSYPLPPAEKLKSLFTMPLIPIKGEKNVALVVPTPTDDGQRRLANVVPEGLHTEQGLESHFFSALGTAIGLHCPLVSKRQEAVKEWNRQVASACGRVSFGFMEWDDERHVATVGGGITQYQRLILIMNLINSYPRAVFKAYQSFAWPGLQFWTCFGTLLYL